MNTPASEKLSILVPAYRMHSQSFLNALKDITNDHWLDRNGGRTNHMAWMFGNFVNCRYWLAGLLGSAETDPHEDLFKDAKALNESYSYPGLDELRKSFQHISPIAYQLMLDVSENKLKEPYHMGMDVPFVEENVQNMIGMCIDREAYLLGQIGLMRKLVGLKAISYEMNEDINY